MPFLRLAASILLLWAASSHAMGGGQGGGRGGIVWAYHTGSLSAFDPQISGNPMVIGGVGFAFTSKSFRIGGGGGGGFLWTGSDNANFGMGYGGAIGEYTVMPWLNARLMIGGGGFSVSRLVSESDTTRTVQKINSGGFLLFYPQLSAEVKISSFVYLAFNLGYFIPNVSKLQSFTMGLNLMFGKL